jgi:hypothetical protein
MKCLAVGESRGESTSNSTNFTPKRMLQRMPHGNGEERSLCSSGRPGRKEYQPEIFRRNNSDTASTAEPVSLQTHVRSLGSAGHYLSGVTKRSILGGFSA